MRVQAGADYVAYVRQVLNPTVRRSDDPIAPETFEGYDLRMFDSAAAMREAIGSETAEFGSVPVGRRIRLEVAEPKTKKNPRPARLRYRAGRASTSLEQRRRRLDRFAGILEEVGSIHTVQGYDLNYAGSHHRPRSPLRRRVARLGLDRDSYFDAKGKESNAHYGKKFGDDDLLGFITNIYAVC